MAFDVNQALLMMKQAIGMMPGINQKDDFLIARIQSEIQEMRDEGMLIDDSIASLMHVVDRAVFKYNNRDGIREEPRDLKQRNVRKWLKSGMIKGMEECSHDP